MGMGSIMPEYKTNLKMQGLDAYIDTIKKAWKQRHLKTGDGVNVSTVHMKESWWIIMPCAKYLEKKSG